MTNNSLNQGHATGGYTESQNPQMMHQGTISANNQNASTNKYNYNYNKKQKIDLQAGQSKKKMICNFYVNGACNKGKECPFSHDAPQVKKTELCKYFLTNNCLKGDECVYSHDTKSYPCKFFHAVGYCEKGENCR